MQKLLVLRSLVEAGHPFPARHAIDQPVAGIDDDEASTPLLVSGWVLSDSAQVLPTVQRGAQVQRFPLNRDRADVIERLLRVPASGHSKRRCGFEISLERSDVPCRLGFEIDGSLHWLYELSWLPYPEVIVGTDGWLYLSQDTNRCIDQFTGRLRMGTDPLKAWQRHFEAMDQVAERLSFRWLMNVSPSKESVIEAYYPIPRQRPGTAEQFMSHFAGRPELRWVACALRACGELAYRKGDTHWTDFGAAIAARDALEQLGIADPGIYERLRYRIREEEGDLGQRLTPARRHAFFELDIDVAESRVLDNAVSNHGRIWVFEQPRPVVDGTCVVFGDSFGVQFIKTLLLHFRRLVYVHSAAAVDLSILEQERPSHVLLQSVARFIVTPPAPIDSFSIRDSVRGKLRQARPRELERVRACIEAHRASASNGFYAALMAEELRQARPETAP